MDSPGLPDPTGSNHGLSASGKGCLGQKRSYFEFSESLASEERHPPNAAKRTKVFTTMSTERSQDVEDLHSVRTLQLARASREALAAHAKYRLLRIHEMDVIRTIAYEKYEEARSLVKNADRQIGEIRHTISMSSSTVPLFQGPGQVSVRLSPAPSCSDSSFQNVEEADFGCRSVSRSSSPARL